MTSSEHRTSEGRSTGGPGEIAIVHDYLTQRGGAERVVLALHRMFPQAPIYTTLYEADATFPEFRNARIVTSPLNRVAVLRRDHRLALPLLPLASSAMRVREPWAIVSSSGWAHGFRFAGRSLVYCHTPARWVYLTEEYLGKPWWRSPVGPLVTVMKPLLRAWDRFAQRRRERYLANSTMVRERIRRVYGRQEVGRVFPPHSVDVEGPTSPIPAAGHLADQGYLLVVSRLLPYKNVGRVIDAARFSGHRLLVIGRGPQEGTLMDRAGEDLGGDVVFARDLSEAQLRWAYSHARLLVAASYEDFGITPLEASAWGVPTVALRAGGYLDTIDEAVNGVFVESPGVEDLVAGIEAADARVWDRAAIRRHAELFSEQRFVEEIGRELELLRRR